jgi:hypothetical protein
VKRALLGVWACLNRYQSSVGFILRRIPCDFSKYAMEHLLCRTSFSPSSSNLRFASSVSVALTEIRCLVQLNSRPVNELENRSVAVHNSCLCYTPKNWKAFWTCIGSGKLDRILTVTGSSPNVIG